MVATRRNPVPRRSMSLSKTPPRRPNTTSRAATARKNRSPQIESKTPSVSKAKVVASSRSSSSEKEENNSDLDTILKSVKQKLIDLKYNVPTLTAHLEPHRESLSALISRCVELKESNSILIEGPAGSGKRGLVRNAIANYEQNSKTKNKVKFVHLNGSIVCDVKDCLREISRQLLTKNSNSNKLKHDQLMNSLAGISLENEDNAEDAEETGDQNEAQSALTVGKSLSFLLTALQESRSNEGQALVFVLESFEHFVQSKSQMLLYNLFDTCQSFKTPLVVIAVSNRLDCSELLEKRVKSRFSHRSITLSNNLSFDQWINCAKDLLKVVPISKHDSISNNWNKSIDNLINNDTVMVKLELLHAAFPFINALKSLLLRFLVQSNFHQSSEIEQLVSNFCNASSKILEGSQSNIARNISLSELILVSAMAKIVKRSDDPCEEITFAAIHQEYLTFARRNGTLRKIDRNIAMNCFDSLVQLKLVSRCDSQGKYGGNKSALKSFRKFRLMLDVSQVHEIVNKHPACPLNVKMWALNTADS